MAWSNALRKRYSCVTKRFGCPTLPTRQNISVLLSDGLDGCLWQPLFYCMLNYASALFKGLNNLRVFSWLPANKWIGMRFLCFCSHAEMNSLIKGTLNERTYLMNFWDSNWAVLSLIFSPTSEFAETDALQEAYDHHRHPFDASGHMIFANTAESPSEAISEASGGTSKDLEKDLPKEERIPTHW